jgi:CubicO group peptidase (beta-lactamase class C family)
MTVADEWDTGGATPVEGFCDPRFDAVEAAFRDNFRLRGEIGAALCVKLDGHTVVELWGGYRDPSKRAPWTPDTLVNTYSVGKGITAMLALSLVERGELDLDRSVTTWWPEFGAEGKASTTLRMLLAHRAGLPAVRRPLEPTAIFDWKTMVDALAGQAPYWEPGSAHGYHVNTHGFLVGEPIVRQLGRPFGQVLRERITGRYGVDFHSGLSATEHHRVATIVLSQAEDLAIAAEMDSGPTNAHWPTGRPEIDAMLPAAYFNPRGFSGFGTVNTPDWRRASIPSTNSHATAVAVATLYDVFLRRDVGQGGMVGAGLRADATRMQSDGHDRVLGRPTRFGLGFLLAQPTRKIGSDFSFGHFGYGGSLGFADPACGLAFGYLMNRPGERWNNPRTNALIDALYACLGGPTST